MVQFTKTIILRWSYVLSSVTTDGKEGNGLKLEKTNKQTNKQKKTQQYFQVLKLS